MGVLGWGGWADAEVCVVGTYDSENASSRSNCHQVVSVFLLTVNILYILVKSYSCYYLCWEIRRAEFLIQDGVEYQEAFIFRRCCVQESNMAAGRIQDERTIPR